MEVSTSPTIGQSAMLAAYSAQQQPAVPRSRERDSGSVDAKLSAEPRRGDNVNFSNEALRLSAQSAQENSKNTVTRTNESESANQQQQERNTANPELQRAESAKSFA